jgi:hypothetical protein
VRCSIAALLGLALIGCSTGEPELWPTRVSQHGGVDLHLRVTTPRGSAVIVLVDGVPAHSVIVEAPGLLRARLPALPRAGEVDVEVLFADATTVRLPGSIEVVAPELEVRARD